MHIHTYVLTYLFICRKHDLLFTLLIKALQHRTYRLPSIDAASNRLQAKNKGQPAGCSMSSTACRQQRRLQRLMRTATLFSLQQPNGVLTMILLIFQYIHLVDCVKREHTPYAGYKIHFKQLRVMHQRCNRISQQIIKIALVLTGAWTVLKTVICKQNQDRKNYLCI